MCNFWISIDFIYMLLMCNITEEKWTKQNVLVLILSKNKLLLYRIFSYVNKFYHCYSNKSLVTYV